MEIAILARHGESTLSVRALANGDPGVSCPLTPLGREQALRLGRALADEPIELAVTSQFERARETAEVALAGRDVPVLEVHELNDPVYGTFEGGPLDEYRAWAHGHGPLDEPPGGGESRAVIVRRYVRGFRTVLDRVERTILVVAHALPIRYVLNAAEGRNPTAVIELVDYAEAYRLSAAELARAVDRLEEWAAAPAF